jgi:dihydrofolate synthase / folylpolyglutamate synthase
LWACPSPSRLIPHKTVNHREALDFLARRGNEVLGIHLGLHRIRTVMQALGNPHLKYPALHIAGTNGKGSVAAMSESILRKGGWKTGLYTSPHLIRVEERVRINGRNISAHGFANLVTMVQVEESALLLNGSLERPLTFFEFITAVAFLHFARAHVDIAVVEVGLGGLLDATNIIYPQACVITGISYDHQDFLGNTLAQIAGEKAGIIKPGITVISGCGRPAARHVILRKARLAGAPVHELGKDFTFQIESQKGGCPVVTVRTPQRTYRRMRLSLAGNHQAGNAALAIRAIELLRSFPVPVSAVSRGLAATVWPGRLDFYRHPRRTLLDGAHNPEGAQRLRDFLTGNGEAEIHLVFSALQDKDIRKMSAALFPLARTIHLAPLSNARSADPHKVAAMHERFRDRIFVHGNPGEALKGAWSNCSSRGVVVVTGSLYLLGALLPAMQKLNRRRIRSL